MRAATVTLAVLLLGRAGFARAGPFPRIARHGLGAPDDMPALQSFSDGSGAAASPRAVAQSMPRRRSARARP